MPAGMGEIRLSICIPVYNFGAFLGETLESIIGQASQDVEVVVLDGGSTDDTTDLVTRFQARFPRITYKRLDKRGGIDRDMARAVELARGDYCWLFSGDDIMRPGAIQRVLGELSEGCDVYLLEAMLCGIDMTPAIVHKMLALPSPRTFRLDDDRERLEYFELALNTAAFFSFCSSLVINRSRWQTTKVDDSFYGSCWAHVARIMAMIPSGLRVRYLTAPFLDKREGNDSFLTDGLAHRWGIAIDGFQRIADTFFTHESREAFCIREALRAELPFEGWVHAKYEIINGRRADQRRLFRRLVLKHYSDRSFKNWKARYQLMAPMPVLQAIVVMEAALRRVLGPLIGRRPLGGTKVQPAPLPSERPPSPKA
jgi:abequosyltransferase